MTTGKAEIRRAMRARRREMSVVDRAAASRSVCLKLLAREDVRASFAKGRPIAVYLASPEEVDLTDFIVAAFAQGAALVAPRWNGSLYELTPLTSLDTLVSGPHGILEPPPSPGSMSLMHRVSVWLVPGLAFSKGGGRIGYGGGWYDRLLTKADEKAAKLGVAFGFQLLDDLPTESHDCPLTEIVTDREKFVVS